MPAYKEKNNTWSSKFKYKDWLGKTRQKCKRGFLKKKDALDYEMEFKSKYMHTPDIMFSALVDNYMRDMIDNKKIAVTTGIACEKDVEIPFKNIWKFYIDARRSNRYDSIHNVYGTDSSLWRDCLKEIRE